MTENERIKQLRKKLNLTLEDFGRRVGVGKSAISDIERGRNAVSEQMRKSVCREFHVSESWLRTGEGEMLIQRSRKEEIEAFFEDIATDDENFRARLISVLAQLSSDQWDLLEDMANKLANKKAPALTPEQEIEEKVANYRKQLLEEKNMASQDFSRSSNDEDGNYETA